MERRSDALAVMEVSQDGDGRRVHLLGEKMSDSKLGQGLPGLDEAHLCFDEAHLGHVLVGFKDPG